MVTIRLGVWGQVPVVSARNAIRQVFANMDLKQGLQWRHVGLMSIRPQWTTDFQLTWCGLMRRKEITSDWSWWNDRWTDKSIIGGTT